MMLRMWTTAPFFLIPAIWTANATNTQKDALVRLGCYIYPPSSSSGSICNSARPKPVTSFFNPFTHTPAIAIGSISLRLLVVGGRSWGAVGSRSSLSSCCCCAKLPGFELERRAGAAVEGPAAAAGRRILQQLPRVPAEAGGAAVRPVPAARLRRPREPAAEAAVKA